MFGIKDTGIHAYAQVGLETGVVDASPLKLTIMLYEGAITACIKAQQALQAQDMVKKSEFLSQASSIIESGLRASLNKNRGGEIAKNLDALYQYMNMTLMQANLHKDALKIQEIQALLMELKSAWEALAKAPSAQTGRNEASLGNMIQQRSQQLQGASKLATAGV